jgi:[NiFe] hydrogenase assembly HybE family chaperone
MNLVLLPDSQRLVDLPQGEQVECRFPSGPCELTVYHDEDLGSYLAAVLFRTVADFPDQDVARAVAEEALANILTEPAEKEAGKVSRRGLLTGLRAS